jgi:hypothetical protein
VVRNKKKYLSRKAMYSGYDFSIHLDNNGHNAYFYKHRKQGLKKPYWKLLSAKSINCKHLKTKYIAKV